jgi:hypothetical protein
MGSNRLVGGAEAAAWEDRVELELRLGSYSRCTFGGAGVAHTDECNVSSLSWRAPKGGGGENRWSGAEESWWSSERGVNPSLPPGVAQIICWLCGVSTKCGEDVAVVPPNAPPEEERPW